MRKIEEILAGIPRVQLFQAPTALERMVRLEKEINGANLYIKRDDCMSLGMGGNKLRSLEFWMGRALEDKNDLVVVAGAPVSNQCRLAAAAAAKVGLDCLILHSADKPERVEGNLLLNYLMGAEIRFIGPVNEEERGQVASETVEALKKNGRSPYLIGDSTLGALGYVSCAFELYAQQLEQECDIKHVFLSGSMGTTEAGFILGNVLLGSPFEIHLISVEYDKNELGARIKKIFNNACAYLNIEVKKYTNAVHIYEEYLGGGYNAPTAEALEAISLAASKEGLFLENTYTSKTFGGMLDLVKKRVVPLEEAACFIHTGGIPALFAQQDLIQPLIGKQSSY